MGRHATGYRASRDGGHTRDGPLAIDADADADTVEAVLLAFEELASNGVRHGRPTVHVTVTSACPGWLLEVSDDDADRPPAPGVGRDAAHGGLGTAPGRAAVRRARLDPAERPQARLGRQLVGDRLAPTPGRRKPVHALPVLPNRYAAALARHDGTLIFRAATHCRWRPRCTSDHAVAPGVGSRGPAASRHGAGET